MQRLLLAPRFFLVLHHTWDVRPSSPPQQVTPFTPPGNTAAVAGHCPLPAAEVLAGPFSCTAAASPREHRLQDSVGRNRAGTVGMLECKAGAMKQRDRLCLQCWQGPRVT